ncbi:hypothetical protein VTJ83DRAFT_598 [Remersonia thermophila]|uniref:RING-type domain-containing protein n=1 Tax=Remersonia thermophila TaxID=72144 RepID=A0ABR4DLN5_9PEZI
MAFLSPHVLEAARIVVRQAAETTLSTIASPSPTDPFTASTGLPPPTTTLVSPSSTTATPTASPTESTTLINGSNNSGNNNNNNNGNSSSLLFFVALGFGVVFTNLWIIVGVKYCFRYNARNRAMRADDGDPINMENMPRPHRRRREKKLMPIDEVNEKFPMLKYKTWVASRARDGLPTRGGVSAPSSRPNSVRDVEGVMAEPLPKERASTDDRPTTSATAARSTTDASADAVASATEKPAARSPTHVPKESTSSTVAGLRRASTESNREADGSEAQKRMSHDDDDDDHIDPALPQECVGTEGDTCAICIDTLEDDDDVRGLTCGHAFHAACIDPWLTTRRACCPLCKADYYTPKPRPPPSGEGEQASGETVFNGYAEMTRIEVEATSPPPRRHVLPPILSRGRSNAAQANGRSSRARDNRSSRTDRQRPRNAPSSSAATAAAPSAPGSGGSGMLSGLRSAYLGFRRGRNQDGADGASNPMASGANTAPTPSQLEAGIRSSRRAS